MLATRLKLAAQALALVLVAGLLGLLGWKLAHQEGGELLEDVAQNRRPAAPGFALPRLDTRGDLALSSLRGKVVLVNFWASWCPPCEDEAPHLAEVSEEYAGEVQFLGVDIVDAREPAREFIRRYGWGYPSVFDPSAAIRDGLGYVGQPITLVYDREGELAWDKTGTIDADELREQIENVL